MVTRGNINWQRHKEDVYALLIKRGYSYNNINLFLQFYANRYDTFGRNFIPYELAWWLRDDYEYVKRVGTYVYAFVGVGGTGKSTLLKNVMYFLDSKFSNKNLHTDIHSFVNDLAASTTIGSMKAIGMDEPDDDIAPQSKDGKILKSIFGKFRQQQLFMGICATDLKDIPTYIWRKLNAIFFLPYLGRAMLFENKPKKGEYILQEIRNEYADKGYQVFFNLSRRKGCLKFNTQRYTPLDSAQELEYLNTKAKDYMDDLHKFAVAGNAESQRDEIIRKMYAKGLTQEKIAEIIGLTSERICQITKKIVL
jgi:hypothetical protein